MQLFVLYSGRDKRAASVISRELDFLNIPHGEKLPVKTPARIAAWGKLSAEQARDLAAMPRRNLLQTPEAVSLAEREEDARMQLAVHGIRTVHGYPGSMNADRRDRVIRRSGVPYSYEYRIPVFHMEALAVYRQKNNLLLLPGSAGTEPSGFQEVSLEQQTFHTQRAVRESVKAVYALGLDYGLVHVAIEPSGRTLVLRVDPAPEPDRPLAALFAQAIGRYGAQLSQELARTEPAVLGSDPEFLLVNPRGKVVSASKYLEREGQVGCDAIVLSGHRVILPLAELRPQPSSEPAQLAANLRRTMRTAARKIGDDSLAWIAGGMPLPGFPLGGHVHFSRCWLNSHLLRALDNYLALPLMMIEGETTALRRPRYGLLGDYRRQRHGGFEYRTLPSWLVSPEIALGVFSLARIIADRYYELDQRPLDDLEAQENYYAGNKPALAGAVESLWADLEKQPMYGEFARYLRPLREQSLRMEGWQELADFRRSWKIGPYGRKQDAARENML
ncbi:putative amidoligase domain-containing protein [Paenibacillus sp. 1P03SA]|uniref:putative amidoligase domain-containing protein n=1 Tax=Paenibacillus sp. 1P03SA TaxID=3132294 RepID=UPI0039A1BB95